MQDDLRLSRIIAHRGASSSAPENTLAAIRKAKESGASWVEFDIQLTKDFVPVCIHDDNVESTTNGVGRVSDLSFAEIKKLDAGSWFSSKFIGEQLPSLDEILKCILDCDLQANIELKSKPETEEVLAKLVCDAVSSLWPTDKPAPLISSFSLTQLAAVRKQSDTLSLGMLMHVWNNDWASVVEDLSCISVHANYRILTKEKVSAIKAKASGCKVLCYTVNSIYQAEKLFDWGVDAIFTDYPAEMVSHFLSVQGK